MEFDIAKEIMVLVSAIVGFLAGLLGNRKKK